MFFRYLDNDIKLGLTIPQYADELFELTDKNRDFLKQWLPWLDSITTPLDTKKFIDAQLLNFQQGKALHMTLFCKDRIAGVLGYNQIDTVNGIGQLGYWLAREYNGRGMMRKSVGEAVKIGFTYYAFNRIEIRCAVDNYKSRAIPESLGFQKEGIIRNAEKVYDKNLDHVVYGLLKEEQCDETKHL
ncbi:GNAT family N-acetyltransferase [uncultured Desulfobacter sp.]|uniref:GNAT family N-acetyltransferase n=1 Tax=uncultured Desulfobacter sp. TaxID=240139 RepID=UPI002AA5E591|nr:GNAT family N-acetyltransferase [uncultured Desulfobacter sp.]